MRVTIHQPEHLPWLGLLAKVAASDAWIVLDSVDYRKNYFQNRNRVLMAGEPPWLTVPVTAPHPTPISAVTVAAAPNWQRRYLGRLAHALPARQPTKVADLIAGAADGSRLVDLNLGIADWMLAQFEVSVPRLLASGLDAAGHKSDLILNLCRAVGADEYLAGPSGRGYLDLAAFAAAGIRVLFFDFEHPGYDQGVEPFIPNLCGLDAWARCDRADLPKLLAGYQLSTS